MDHVKVGRFIAFTSPRSGQPPRDVANIERDTLASTTTKQIQLWTLSCFQYVGHVGRSVRNIPYIVLERIGILL